MRNPLFGCKCTYNDRFEAVGEALQARLAFGRSYNSTTPFSRESTIIWRISTPIFQTYSSPTLSLCNNNPSDAHRSFDLAIAGPNDIFMAFINRITVIHHARFTIRNGIIFLPTNPFNSSLVAYRADAETGATSSLALNARDLPDILHRQQPVA